MSTLLEQAIVDAEALKEVALKNAETRILERYSSEVKKTLNTLLEQDEEEDPRGLGGDEGGDDMGGDLGGDMGMDLGGEEEAEEEEVVKGMPDAFADGEKLCPCPDDEEEIEIDFNDLARQLQGDDEGAAPDDMIDREEEFGLGGEEEDEEDLGGLMEDKGKDAAASAKAGTEHAEDIGAITEEEEDEAVPDDLMEMLATALLEEVHLDAVPVSDGYGGTTTAAAEEAALLSMAGNLVNTDDKETKEFEDEELADLTLTVAKTGEENLLLQKEKERLAERLEKTKTLSKQEIAKLKKQKKGLENRISTLQEQVLKVNLVNAKLLYTNKALKSASLNERQKNTIVESLSKASSVDEAKTIYETLQSTVTSAPNKRTPNSLSEAVSRGRASTLFANRRKETKVESNTELARWKILAGLDKN